VVTGGEVKPTSTREIFSCILFHHLSPDRKSQYAGNVQQLEEHCQPSVRPGATPQAEGSQQDDRQPVSQAFLLLISRQAIHNRQPAPASAVEATCPNRVSPDGDHAGDGMKTPRQGARHQPVSGAAIPNQRKKCGSGSSTFDPKRQREFFIFKSVSRPERTSDG
jgi:hypothetical protein